MKCKIMAAINILLVLSTMGFIGCRGAQTETGNKIIVPVIQGDLLVTVPVTDGSLKGPIIQLSFDTNAFKSPYSSVIAWERPGLKEGDFVRAGTLLARLDDFYQRENVKAAMYDVESEMNNLVQRIPAALAGYSKTYPDVDAALSLAQTREELQQTKEMLKLGRYQEAASKLLLAQHDIEGSLKIFDSPEIKQLTQETDEFLGLPYERYPEIPEAIKSLEQNLKQLIEIQNLIEKGGQSNYNEAINSLDTASPKFEETYSLVKSLSGRIVVSQRIGECCQQLTCQQCQQPGTSTGFMTLPYPDMSTSLDWIRQVQEDLQEIQSCKEGGCDESKLSTLLGMARHDAEMSQTILADNELTFRSGLNLQKLRQFNLSVQSKRAALEIAKESLSKTELLAPIDGFVQQIHVKQNQKVKDSSVIDLIGTDNWTMAGFVKAVDIDKVKVGQEAIVKSKDVRNAEVKGKVTRISLYPIYNETTKHDEFPITISIEPHEVRTALESITYLTKLSLNATADIIIGKHKDVLLVPNGAIKGPADKHWVDLVIDEKTGITKKREVSVIAQSDNLTEIDHELKEGDKVIVQPK